MSTNWIFFISDIFTFATRFGNVVVVWSMLHAHELAIFIVNSIRFRLTLVSVIFSLK